MMSWRQRSFLVVSCVLVVLACSNARPRGGGRCQDPTDAATGDATLVDAATDGGHGAPAPQLTCDLAPDPTDAGRRWRRVPFARAYLKCTFEGGGRSRLPDSDGRTCSDVRRPSTNKLLCCRGPMHCERVRRALPRGEDPTGCRAVETRDAEHAPGAAPSQSIRGRAGRSLVRHDPFDEIIIDAIPRPKPSPSFPVRVEDDELTNAELAVRRSFSESVHFSFVLLGERNTRTRARRALEPRFVAEIGVAKRVAT